MDTGENFFVERVVRHWNLLPSGVSGGVVESLPLEKVNRHVDVPLGDMV